MKYLRELVYEIEPLLIKVRNETLEEACKAMCPMCREGVPVNSGGIFDGYHMLTELGGAKDGGTDYEECKAAAIRALIQEEDR